MTTTVKIEAHCSKDKQVRIFLDGHAYEETKIIQDGETIAYYIYDDREISVIEEFK